VSWWWAGIIFWIAFGFGFIAGMWMGWEVLNAPVMEEDYVASTQSETEGVHLRHKG
jgi:hypothetical protein